MNHSRPMIFGLALTGLGFLGTLEARPVAAQVLTYTLENVTFDDGAVAYGSFEFNPTTQILDSYDITTTDGTNDNLLGTHYTMATGTPQSVVANEAFQFYDNDSTSLLTLDVGYSPPLTSPTSAGVHSIIPGLAGPFSVSGSGENVGIQGFFIVPRAITSGEILIAPAAVPEASTTVSFGLLLALGLGGGVIATRKKKTTVLPK